MFCAEIESGPITSITGFGTRVSYVTVVLMSYLSSTVVSTTSHVTLIAWNGSITISLLSTPGSTRIVLV